MSCGKSAIIPGHMVWHEVYNHFKSRRMSSFHKFMEFFHPVFRFVSQIWVHIVIVRDGIRRTGTSLHPVRRRRGASVAVFRCRVSDYSCVPDMRNTKTPKILQRDGVNAAELSAPIVFQCAVFDVFSSNVSPKTRKHLIYDDFTHLCSLFCKNVPIQLHISCLATSNEKNVDSHKTVHAYY